MGNRMSHWRGEDAAMIPPPHCPRCRGLMFSVNYGDWGDPQDTPTGRAWNCIHCGEIIDPVIMTNRRNGAPAKIEKPRVRLPTGF
jgi:hypothetical protein